MYEIVQHKSREAWRGLVSCLSFKNNMLVAVTAWAIIMLWFAYVFVDVPVPGELVSLLTAIVGYLIGQQSQKS